jgi:hypothetical protein
MAAKLYVLFVYLADADYCAGVYESEADYKKALVEIGNQIGEPMEEDEYEVLETELNKLETFMVTPYGGDEEEEE